MWLTTAVQHRNLGGSAPSRSRQLLLNSRSKVLPAARHSPLYYLSWYSAFSRHPYWGKIQYSVQKRLKHNLSTHTIKYKEAHAQTHCLLKYLALLPAALSARRRVYVFGCFCMCVWVCCVRACVSTLAGVDAAHSRKINITRDETKHHSLSSIQNAAASSTSNCYEGINGALWC